MREILFRGKTDKGEWVQGSLIKRKIGCFIVDENNQCALRKATENLFDFESKLVISETIGQYTGLTDKNGTKIFEGDILRYGYIYDYECYLESLERHEEYDNEIYDQDIEVSMVEWCSDCDYPAFDLADHDFECNGLSQIMCGDYEYEVIGNIHDNPELVKEREG